MLRDGFSKHSLPQPAHRWPAVPALQGSVLIVHRTHIVPSCAERGTPALRETSLV